MSQMEGDNVCVLLFNTDLVECDGDGVTSDEEVVVPQVANRLPASIYGECENGEELYGLELAQRTERFLCVVCDKQFGHRQQLRSHYQRLHQEDVNKLVESRPSRGGRGGPTDRQRATFRRINRHLCQTCGKHFADNWTLSHHQRTAHLCLREHGCRHCGRSFLSRKDLVRHVQGVHLKKRIVYPGQLHRKNCRNTLVGTSSDCQQNSARKSTRTTDNNIDEQMKTKGYVHRKDDWLLVKETDIPINDIPINDSGNPDNLIKSTPAIIKQVNHAQEKSDASKMTTFNAVIPEIEPVSLKSSVDLDEQRQVYFQRSLSSSQFSAEVAPSKLAKKPPLNVYSIYNTQYLDCDLAKDHPSDNFTNFFNSTHRENVQLNTINTSLNFESHASSRCFQTDASTDNELSEEYLMVDDPFGIVLVEADNVDVDYVLHEVPLQLDYDNHSGEVESVTNLNDGLKIITVEKEETTANNVKRDENCHHCDQCDLKFKTKALVTRHKKQMHNLTLRLLCSHCTKTFNSQTSLSQHESSVHNGVRNKCTKCGIEVIDLTRHIRLQHERGNSRPYPCEKCPARFKTQFQMERHTKAVHLGIRPYECGMCDKRFAAKRDKQRHLRLVHLKGASQLEGQDHRTQRLQALQRSHKQGQDDMCDPRWWVANRVQGCCGGLDGPTPGDFPEPD